MPVVRGNPAEKWSRRASQAATDYAAGVAQPRVSWQSAAAAAEAAWAAGVQAAVQAKRFGRGVARAGDGKWATRAQRLGTQRYGPGVAEAQGTYSEAVGPYLQVIQGLQLPARGPKGDPRNLERVAVIARALHQKKVGG